MVSLKLFLVSLLVGAAVAQRRPTTTTTARPAGTTQSLYGQCGGESYTGPSACPTSAYCKHSNQWYSQCVLPDGASAAPGEASEVRTLTTIFSVGGPNPTVISTRITYLVPRPTTTAAQSVVTLTLVPDEPCNHEYYC